MKFNEPTSQKNWLWISFILICILLIVREIKSCQSTTDQRDTIKVERVTYYDTTIYSIVEKQPIYLKETINVPVRIDTLDSAARARIAIDYFQQYVFSDTIRDSSIEAFITDTVSKNSIIARGFQYRILRPTEIINNTIVDNSPKLFLSGFASDGYGVAILRSEKRLLYGAGYDFKNKKPNLWLGIRLK